MHTYVCPKCSAIQDSARMPPKYLWSSVYTFRCQNCATMLRLAPLRRRWVGYAAFPIMLAIYVPAQTYSRPAFRVAFFVSIGVGVCTLLVQTWIPLDVVVHSDE